MNQSQSLLRISKAAVGTIVLVCTGFVPAQAWQDPGPSIASSATERDWHNCAVERIGTQLIRCDDLTGAGVTAPSWVPTFG